MWQYGKKVKFLEGNFEYINTEGKGVIWNHGDSYVNDYDEHSQNFTRTDKLENIVGSYLFEILTYSNYSFFKY